MLTVAKFLILLSLVLWIGGIVFFSAVVAPSVFGVLTPVAGGRHMAGDIVNRSLGALHWMGLGCGAVFLIASTRLQKRFGRAANYLVLAMLVLTAISQFGISRKMAAIRAKSPEIEAAPETQRAEFAQLHRLSTMTEGAVLLCGLGVVGLVSRRMN